MSGSMRWASMVGLLLRMSSRRARARMRVQARRNRSVSAGSMYAFALFGGLMFQVLVATAFVSLVNTASELDLATDGRIVVSSWLYESMKGLDDALGNGASTEVVATHRRDFSSALSYEAITSERRAGGDACPSSCDRRIARIGGFGPHSAMLLVSLRPEGRAPAMNRSHRHRQHKDN